MPKDSPTFLLGDLNVNMLVDNQQSTTLK
jgi:hypothetical protein